MLLQCRILHFVLPNDPSGIWCTAKEVSCNVSYWNDEWMSGQVNEGWVRNVNDYRRLQMSEWLSRVCVGWCAWIDCAAAVLLLLLLLSECCCRPFHIINQLFTTSLLIFHERGCCGQLLMNCARSQKALRRPQITYHTLDFGVYGGVNIPTVFVFCFSQELRLLLWHLYSF